MNLLKYSLRTFLDETQDETAFIDGVQNKITFLDETDSIVFLNETQDNIRLWEAFTLHYPNEINNFLEFIIKKMKHPFSKSLLSLK